MVNCRKPDFFGKKNLNIKFCMDSSGPSTQKKIWNAYFRLIWQNSLKSEPKYIFSLKIWIKIHNSFKTTSTYKTNYFKKNSRISRNNRRKIHLIYGTHYSIYIQHYHKIFIQRLENKMFINVSKVNLFLNVYLTR